MKLAALLVISCLTVHAADLASWYGEKHRGLPMANGKRFDPDQLTAASWFFDLGTKVVVTHAHRSVVVEITDRGPAKRLVKERRKIDLGRAAFARLADPELGLIPVTITKLGDARPFSTATQTSGGNEVPFAKGSLRSPAVRGGASDHAHFRADYRRSRDQ